MLSDFDPPAVAQPSLAPPSLAPPLTARLRRWALPVGVATIAAGVALAVTHKPAEPPPAPAVAHVAPDLLFKNMGVADTAEQTCNEHVGTTPMVMYSAGGEGSSATPDAALFAGAVPASEIPSRVAGSSHLAILRTVEMTAPRSVAGAPAAGRYEAHLAVFDTATGKRVCGTRIVAWSSDAAVQPGISARTLQADFTDRVHAAVSDAAARLRITLEL